LGCSVTYEKKLQMFQYTRAPAHTHTHTHTQMENLTHI